MMHRTAHAKFVSSSSRSLGATAVALAVAALFVAPPAGVARESGRAEHAIDWDQRIHDAMVATGTVDAVAAELAAASAESPAVIRAKARVAIEQGDLAAATRQLQFAVGQSPSDTSLLLQLALLQEKSGATAGAQKSLRSALVATKDADESTAVTLRLAAIAFDAGEPGDAVKWLDRAAAAGPAAGAQAGVLAYLYGQYEVAARCLHSSAGDDVALLLFEGNAALKAIHPEAAVAAFTKAFDVAKKPADRLYAQERLIATARQAGTLPGLADAWLADKSLPAERLLPLATILRETDRVGALLDWWRTAAADPKRSESVMSERFVHEVLGAARAAGRTDDAIAICRDLLGRHPDDPQWLSATLQALLGAGRAQDADTLLTARIAEEAEVPAELERLGKLAQAAGRDEIAILAAKKLTTFGGAQAIAGQLLEAGVQQRSGQIAKAEELLRSAATTALAHPVGLGRVIGAMESANLNADAITLLQRSAESDPSEDNLSRLTSLLLKEHRNAEAMPVLEQLMRSGSSVSVRSQAGMRLLSAAGADGLAPIIEQLKTRLQSDRGTEQDLSLLVDAYLRQPDFGAAVAAIEQSRLLDEPTRLSRLAVLYLRTKKFDEADGVLRKLVTADPDNATETLERLATVNLSRKRPDEAAKVIAEIGRRLGGGPTSGELMAGVFDRLGRPGDAAAGYRRAVAANPEIADDWLLWATAMSKAGRATIARNRLQVLCGEAPNDNVFATAVDGLLNLSSPGSALRVARRDAILRVAARPHRTILYHLVADLSDETHDAAAVVRATEASVAVSDEERPQRLRELMDVAAQKGDINTAVDCGRSLLALGDDFPPLLFVQLGEQLLVADRLADASRAFARASESSDAQLIGNRVAELYEKYGYPSSALDALRASSDRQRNNAEYREHVARLSEIVGDGDAAFEQFMAAMTIAGRELTLTNFKPDQTPAAMKAAAAQGVTFGPSKAEGAFTRIVAGAVASARTPAQQTAVVDALRSMLASLIAEAASADAPPVGVTHVAGNLRRAGFGFARPDIADAADAAVLTRWPDAEDFKKQAMTARAEEGFTRRAAMFAAAYGLEAAPANRSALPTTLPSTAPSVDSIAAPTSAGPTTAAAVSPQLAAAALPGLLAQGKSDAARALLASTPFQAVAVPDTADALRPPASPFQTLTAAACALGETELATKWALFWLDAQPTVGPQPKTTMRPMPRPAQQATAAAGTAGPAAAPPGAAAMSPAAAATGSSGSAAPTPNPPARSNYPFMSPANSALTQGYVRTINAAWPLLSPDGRKRLAERMFERLSAIPDAEARGALSLQAFQMALAVGLKPPMDATRMCAEALAVPDIDPIRRAANVFTAVPAADRPKVLPIVFASVPEMSQLELLNRIVGRVGEPFDSDTAAAIVAAAQQATPGQSVFWDDWFTNAAQGPLLKVLADAMLRTAIDPAAPDTATLTTAAAAYANAGDQDRANAVAAQAIELLRLPQAPPAPPKMPASGRMIVRMPPVPMVLLRAAVAAMSPAARGKALSAIEAAAKEASMASLADVAWRNLMRAVLLDATGNRPEALAALRAAYAADPNDSTTAQAYLSRLSDDGRWAELVAAFAQRSSGTDSESAPFKRGVGQALQELLRWREVRAGAERPGVSVDMASQAAVGDVKGLALSLRVLLQNFRTSRAWVPFPAMPGASGLTPTYSARTQEPPAVLNELAAWPGSLDDALRALQMLPETSRFSAFDEGSSWVAKILVRAAADQKVRDRIVAALTPAVDAHLLTRAERQLVTGLATIPGYRLPATWIDELWPAALADTSGNELRRLGRALAAQGVAGAANVLAWADVAPASRNGPRNRAAVSSPLDRLGDGEIAEQLSALCDKDPAAAESQLREARASGRLEPPSYRTNVLWARMAAERGDAAEFRTRVKAVFTAWAWDHLTPKQSWVELEPSTAPDLRDALPSKPANSTQRTAWMNALRTSLADLSSQWPSETEITRQLVSLGEWSLKQGDRASAEALFGEAKALADRQGLGEHQLWVADLAALLGNQDESLAIQRRLLEERCLPAVRIAPVLRALDQKGEAEAVRQLAADAATYFRVPVIAPKK